MASTSSSDRGIGFVGLLTIVFIFLKLNPGGRFTTGVADWSWWWVLSPLWISFAIGITILLIAIPFLIWKD